MSFAMDWFSILHVLCSLKETLSSRKRKAKVTVDLKVLCQDWLDLFNIEGKKLGLGQGFCFAIRAFSQSKKFKVLNAVFFFQH